MQITMMAAVVMVALWGMSDVANGQTSAQFEDQHLFASDARDSDRFGRSASVSGDVAIIGAYLKTTVGGLQAGSGYIYRWNGSNWIEEAHLMASDGEMNERFGISVSVSDDVAIVGTSRDYTTWGI